MPEVKYVFTATGGREIVDTFRSIESVARAAARAQVDFDKSARLGGGGRGGPFRSAPASALAGGGGGGGGQAARAAKASAEQLISIEEHAARKKLAIARRYEEQRLGVVRSSSRAIEREIEREERAAARVAARRRSMVSGAMGSVGRTILSGAGSLIGSGIDLAGGLVRESAKTQAIANRVSIGARGAGQAFVDPTALRKEFETAAIANPGIAASEVGLGVKKYVSKTGDLKAAREFAGTFATFATATESSVEEVARSRLTW